ncbi:MAG: glycosyl transferase family 1, partial [Bacteroidales bacterium]|nr:glycosyl transferase family 1 [Bacteroidales bacterium]
IGYQVDVVEGPGCERKRLIKEIKQKIQSGVKYDFLYSESSVMPTLLTESHHFPIYPALDFSFFSFCKKNNIPIGLFYRDIHWRFINKNKGWKQRVAKYFYKYDLKQYAKLLDVLFLPTLRMLPHIPFSFLHQIVELPAGCDIAATETHTFDSPLQLLYIGGIGGNYDLKTFLEAVKSSPSVHLTLCCRFSDWNRV